MTSQDIKNYRIKHKLTQTEFGRLINSSQKTISEFETGKKVISINFALKFKGLKK
jgi:DNA-binding XRE family transcriptional regulator